MTTYIGTPVAWGTHTTTAPTNEVFRARYQQIVDALSGAGLVQTADTGQFDLVNGTYPASSGTAAAPVIFRFSDSLQGTDPVFISVAIGRGAQSGYCRIEVQIGSGTDGNANLTGNVSATLVNNNGINATQNSASAIGAMICFACHVEGYAGFMLFGMNDGSTPYNAMALVAIERTKNQATGAFDGRGVNISWSSAGTQIAWSGFRTDGLFSASPASSDYVCLVPGVPADTSNANGDKQLYPHFYPSPEPNQFWSIFTIRGSDFPDVLSTFSAAPFLGASRTFLSMGTRAPVAESSGNGNFVACVLWE